MTKRSWRDRNGYFKGEMRIVQMNRVALGAPLQKERRSTVKSERERRKMNGSRKSEINFLGEESAF